MKKLLLYTVLILSQNLYAHINSISIERRITALYIAYFQRAPDYNGLMSWSNSAKNIETEEERDNILKDISKGFSHQPIFIDTYSDMDNITFVKSIYKNILGKAGDKSGIDFWTALLDSGISRSEMIADFIDTSISKTISKKEFPNLSDKELKEANIRKRIIENKIEVALYFTNSLKESSNIHNISDVEDDPAYIASKEILTTLDTDPLDTTRGRELIDMALRSDDPLEAIIEKKFVSIIGKITYERPTIHSNHIGLNFHKIFLNPASEIVVKLVDSHGKTISTTSTNNQGEYSFYYAPKNMNVKIEAYALMVKDTKESSWDVRVVDNTHGDALYVVEGEIENSKDKNQKRNLKIPLKNRISAPFSILTDIHKAMKKISDVNQTIFPALTINWSTNNTPSDGELSDGQILTSFFDGDDSIYLLGDESSDSDEFDTNVIIHEWSHYFEKNFSRADSIGGSHGDGDRLDIRVAFSEGFGNAWSAIVTDNPIYTDTSNGGGWFMNIEKDTTIDAGWWSESSIQKILYDLYDEKNEPYDNVSFGLKPIYDVLTTTQKNTKAFTSIFPFITSLKRKNPLFSSQIDELLLEENIESITDDIYGDEHHNLYSNLGDEVCTYSTYGYSNKLLNHKYIRFTIDVQHRYNISVEQSNGDNADPDFTLYSVEPFLLKKSVNSSISWIEKSKIFLRAGDYILDISDYNNINEACFHIAIE